MKKQPPKKVAAPAAAPQKQPTEPTAAPKKNGPRLAYGIEIKPGTNGLYVLVTYEIAGERVVKVQRSVEDIRDMIMAKLNDALAIVPQL